MLHAHPHFARTTSHVCKLGESLSFLLHYCFPTVSSLSPHSLSPQGHPSPSATLPLPAIPLHLGQKQDAQGDSHAAGRLIFLSYCFLLSPSRNYILLMQIRHIAGDSLSRLLCWAWAANKMDLSRLHLDTNQGLLKIEVRIIRYDMPPWWLGLREVRMTNSTRYFSVATKRLLFCCPIEFILNFSFGTKVSLGW
jgi:hypothetical protein